MLFFVFIFTSFLLLLDLFLEDAWKNLKRYVERLAGRWTVDDVFGISVLLKIIYVTHPFRYKLFFFFFKKTALGTHSTDTNRVLRALSNFGMENMLLWLI